MRISLTGAVVVAGAIWATTAAAQLPARTAPSGATPLTTTVTTAARMRELRCRGEAGAYDIRVQGPSPRIAGYVTMEMRYRRSETSPGTDWMGIDAGTCSWNDRTAPPEPGQVYFDVSVRAQTHQMLHGSSTPDTTAIREYLSERTHFWTFYVPEVGPQIAVSHGAWRPAVVEMAAGPNPRSGTLSTTREGSVDVTRRAESGIPGSRETPVQRGTGRLADTAGRGTTADLTSRWRINDLKVTPALEGASISFVAVPGVEPEAAILLGLSGTRTLPLQVRATRSGSATRYTARTTSPLRAATTYRYRIVVPLPGGGVDSLRGEFTTLTQYARVVVTEIHVSDDADAGIAVDLDDAGEIEFGLHVSTGTRGEPAVPIGQFFTLPRQEWSSGDRRAPSPEAAFTVGGAPHYFIVSVIAHEDDAGFKSIVRDVANGAVAIANVTATLPDALSFGKITLYQDGFVEPNTNYAAHAFDLSKIPGTGGRIPFQMFSQPQKDGLAFDVRGYIDVSRR